MDNIRYNYDEDNEVNIIRKPDGTYLIYNYDTSNKAKDLLGEYTFGRYKVIDKELLGKMFFGMMKSDQSLKSKYLEFINQTGQSDISLYTSISNSLKNI